MTVNEIEKFYEFYYKLEQIPRTGWIMSNVPEERLESIADHTLQTIMLSTIIAKDQDLNINYEKLYQMLLIHDLAESIVGDISEISEEHKSKREKEEFAIKEILKTLPKNIAHIFFELWLDFEEKRTPEAIFAYQIDKLDAILKAKLYSKKHNIPKLFEEFRDTQLNKKTFINSQVEPIFNEIAKIKK